jgi:hypothetical protein
MLVAALFEWAGGEVYKESSSRFPRRTILTEEATVLVSAKRVIRWNIPSDFFVLESAAPGRLAMAHSHSRNGFAWQKEISECRLIHPKASHNSSKDGARVRKKPAMN